MIRPHDNPMPTQPPIAVVGMSCLFPNAAGLKEYWRLIRRSEDAITEVPATHWSADDYYDARPDAPDRVPCRRGGFLAPTDFDPTEFGVPPAILEATDTAQLLGLVVAKAALEDAGYGEGREFDRTRAGVILGVTGTLELVIPLGARLGGPVWTKALREAGVDADTAAEVVRRIGESYVSWQESSFPGLLGNVVAGRVANRFNLRGTNCVVDAACASSISAMHLASMELISGKADMVLTGGVDTFNDIFMFMCFSKTQAISASGDAKPFSADADGTVLGEGVGMLVLKRLADAERDGDRIHAVLRGIGTSSDGRSQSIYAPRAEGQADALRGAYRAAGIDPATIELVEAHGTGTKVGDVVEFEALRSVFRASRPSGTWCALGSVKSQIGHTKAAAGAASMIKTILALRHRTLPATIKVTEPNPKLDLAGSPFYLSTETRPWVHGGSHPRRAAVSSFGFGGSNFHAVLEEYPDEIPVPAWDGSVEIVALSDRNMDGLRRQLQEWSSVGERKHADLAQCAAESRASFNATDPHRLVLVIEHSRSPETLFSAALDALSSHNPEQDWSLPDVFYEGPRTPTKVAFLFPGQASQYVGMGRDLTCVFPEALAAIEEADSADDGVGRLSSLIFPQPTLDADIRAEQQAALTQTDVAQPAIGAVSLACLRVLERFGVRPAYLAGHSYGELVALRAAGRVDDDTLRHLSRERGRLMAAGDGDRGTMAAVQAPLAELEALVSKHAGVVLANRNSPTQGVISGPRDAVEHVLAACRECGWRATPLDVSAAFHSALMAEAGAAFERVLTGLKFDAGHTPVYANVTARAYPDDANAARELLARQLTSPVEFAEMVEALHAEGVGTWVEVGPKSTLCALVRATLGERPHVAVSMDASAGRGSGMLDLARLLARLASLGHAVNLKAWESPSATPRRKPKMVVSLVGANYRSKRKARSEHRPEPAPGNNGKKTMNTPDHGQQARTSPSSESRSALSTNTPATPPAPAPIAPVEAEAMRGTWQVVQEGLRAMQALQQQTAAAHQRFLEGQELAQRTFQQVLAAQQQLMERVSGVPMPTAGSLPSTEHVHPSATAVVGAQSNQAPGVAEPPSAQAAHRGNGKWSAIETALLELVSEKTGYPLNTIHLDMDMEADLGIDPVRRVEMLNGLTQRLPSLPIVPEDEILHFRTLRDVVDRAVNGKSNGETAKPPAPAPPQPVAQAPVVASTSNESDSAGFETALLDIVAELTGYPAEMLELDMDMEADLGIDSIKRVEVLAAVQERYPQMKAVNSAYMGSLRTLRSIIDYMSEGEDPDASTTGGEDPLKKNDAQRPHLSDEPAGGTAAPLGRRELVAVELTVAEPSVLPVAPDHEIWITDDGSGLAAHLAEQFTADGRTARLIDPAQISDDDSLAPVGGLIVVAPRAESADGLWSAAAESRLKAAFALTKSVGSQLRHAAEHGGALLATVSRLDGAFGLRGGSFDPSAGGLAGLTKTVACEWTGVTCRAFDVSPELDDAIAAAAVARELASCGPIEVGLDGAGRWGVEPVDSEPQADGALPIGEADVVIVTGGARGVTAEAAVALARAAGPTLVLLGRSPAPEPEPPWLAGVEGEAAIKKTLLIHRFAGGPRPSPAQVEAAYRRVMANREIGSTLARIEAAGAQAIYRSVDVCDRAAVAGVIDEVRTLFGPIRGVIHGAGVIEDRLIADKAPEQFDKVFDTKVPGLRHLLAELEGDDLACLVLFSSVSGRFGRQGQVDYAMANEVLNKAAQRQAALRPECRVVSINWGPWDGGMVTPALAKEFARLGIALIPLEAGAASMVAELRHGGGVEVLIGGSFPEAQPTAPPLAVESPAAHLDVTIEQTLSVVRHPFLAAHVLKGRPVLPAAMMFELMGHGALHANPGLVLSGLERFRVLRGVAVDRPYTIRIGASLARRVESGFAVDVELCGGADGRHVLHARAVALLADRISEAPSFDASDDLVLQRYERSIDAMYRDIFFHGEIFRGIVGITGLSQRGMRARLRTAPPPADWMDDPWRSAWLTDPLAIDVGWQLGYLWCYEMLGAPGLPSYCERYRQFAAFPPGELDAVLVVRKAMEHKLTANVTFLDAAGSVVALMEGCDWTADTSILAAAGHGQAVVARQ